MKYTVVFIAGVLASFIVFSLQKSAAATANHVADFSASSQSSFYGDGCGVMRPSLDSHPSPRTAFTAAQAGSSCAAIFPESRSQEPEVRSQSSIVNRQSSIETARQSQGRHTECPARMQRAGATLPAAFPLSPSCPSWLKKELPTIAEAAAANGITTLNDYAVLLAIRCAENGRAGRQFGVLHPRAVDTDLRTQAGWAAATVVNTRRRYLNALGGKEVSPAAGRGLSDRPAAPDADGFIDFLADRYCPPSADPVGHANWKKNVKFYYQKFYHEGHEEHEER